jgi:hypothetical protein
MFNCIHLLGLKYVTEEITQLSRRYQLLVALTLIFYQRNTALKEILSQLMSVETSATMKLSNTTWVPVHS